ncbi:hypothetical protein IWW37_000786 [Coemansia sp. RSA 2050]|nr:hypothetical protein IWW37_000786 [Coemansia sp. RSA 2050]KAJ2732291.1 hypothetical protein IW152_003915 [Coemansia sp. BCRC 34962]
MAMVTRTGRVKFFSSQKGFGFVIPDEPIDGDAEVFVHHTVIHNGGGFKSLADGEHVEFEVTRGPKGLQATRVSGPNGGFVRGDPFVRFRAKPRVTDSVSSPSVTSTFYAYSPYPPGYGPFGQMGQQPQFGAFTYPAVAQQQQPGGAGFVVQSGPVAESHAPAQLGLPPQFFSPSNLAHHQPPPPPPPPLTQQQSSLDVMTMPYDMYFRQQSTVLQAYEHPAAYVMPSATMGSSGVGQNRPQIVPPNSSSPTLAFTAAPSRQGSKASLLSVNMPPPFTGGFPE